MADQAEVSRLLSEYLYLENPQGQISCVLVEYLYTDGDPLAKVGQLLVEYLYEERSLGGRGLYIEMELP